jgi:hypothetical protein
MRTFKPVCGRTILLLVLLAGLHGGQLRASGETTPAHHFCHSCVDEQSALQRALHYAPPVHCHWPGGQPTLPPPENLECVAQNRQVLLANPATSQIFSYRLVFNQDSNRHEIQQNALNPSELEAVALILAFHGALLSADFSEQVPPGMLNATQGSAGDGEACPQGTALDHILQPHLRGWMVDRLRSSWLDVAQVFQANQASVSRTMGINATVGLVTLNLRWDDVHPEPAERVFLAGFRFSESEVDHPLLQDMLVFQVNSFHWVNGQPVMDIEFRQSLSRAAGHGVPELISGQVAIEDACVLQKIADLEELGYSFTSPSGSGGGLPPLAIGDEYADGDAEACFKTVRAYVDGEFAFQFVVRTVCE